MTQQERARSCLAQRLGLAAAAGDHIAQRAVEGRGGAGDVMLRRRRSPARRRPWCAAAPDRRSNPRSAAAKAPTSPGEVSRPVTSSVTIDGTPPEAPATTGRPAACASSRRHAVGLVDRRPDQEIGGARRTPAAPPAAARRRSARARAPAGSSVASTRARRPVADDQQLPGLIGQLLQRRGPARDRSELVALAHHRHGRAARAGPLYSRSGGANSARSLAPHCRPRRNRRRRGTASTDEHGAGSATTGFRHSASAGLSEMMASAWAMAACGGAVANLAQRPPARLGAWEASATR